MARLQTFPDDIRISGGRGSIQRQLGNAVPSLLGEVLAREIARQFFGVAPSPDPDLSVPARRPIPEPEKLRPVPAKFRKHIGDHADHPGTGLGRAALSRDQVLPLDDAAGEDASA
jgi:DNA (cytosine-5)-methyltransferase 1